MPRHQRRNGYAGWGKEEREAEMQTMAGEQQGTGEKQRARNRWLGTVSFVLGRRVDNLPRVVVRRGKGGGSIQFEDPLFVRHDVELAANVLQSGARQGSQA